MRTQFFKRLSFLCCLGIVLFGVTFHAQAATQFAFISPTNTWKYNDESIDLGTAWIAPGYNDSAWSNGAVAIGFAGLGSTNESLPPPNFIRTLPRKNTPTNAARNIMTFYFRANFTLTNSPGGMTLIASNLIDDGAVFYLNGLEVGRVAMPEGAVTWDTQALRNDDIGTSRVPTVNTHGYDVFTVPIDALVQGNNVMAVEVHQANTGSSDFAFQTELWAVFPDPTFLSITNQPQPVSVEEGKAVEVRVGVSGAGAHYQWYRRNTGGGATAIPGAFGDRYFIQSGVTNDTGVYYVVVSNAVNSRTSSDVQITVVTDTTGPILVNADGSLSPTNVLVNFLDPVLPSTATNLANYRITNTLGGALLAVTRAVLTTPTNVLLTAATPRVSLNNYLLIVNGVRDTSLRTNLITANSMFPISNLASNIIPMTADWRFYDPYPPFDAPNLGTAWREVNYVETNAWADGAAGFYDQSAGGGTFPVPVNTFLGQTPTPITYFRHRISGFQFGSGSQRFQLTYAIDDGAIIYLNGNEVLRVNMPAGTVTYQTLASTAVGNAVRTGPVALTNVFSSGDNVIAVELHQNTTIDVDKGFALQLDAFVRSVGVGPAIIAAGPYNVTVAEGQDATFTVVQVGGTSFQWQQGTANLAGETGDSLTLPNVTFAMNNRTYRILVTGANGTVQSTNATLRVITDTNPPALVSASVSGANSIVVSFSEAVSAATAQAVANYTVTNSSGQSVAVTSASLANGTDVTLSFASLPVAQYFVVVNRVRDTSTTGNVIATNSAVKAGFESQVVSYDSTWRYDQRAINLTPQGWTARTYNDAAWSGSGPGLLDADTPPRVPASLPLPVGTVLLAPTAGPGGAYLSTTYFRTHFNSYGSGSGTLTYNSILDDSSVVYLNGVEVHRVRMPAGVPNFATLGVGTAPGDAIIESWGSFPVTNILAGDNVIAVEVHQIGTASSDVTWGGEFSVSVPSMVLAPPGTCIPNPVAPPTLLAHRAANGTNVVLSWTNPTDNCGTTVAYSLQQTLVLAPTPAATIWSTVTSVSPHTAVGTNTTRFFRLMR